MNPITRLFKWLTKGPKHNNPILKLLGTNHSFVEIGSALYYSRREVIFQCSVCGVTKGVVQERKHK